MENNIYFQIELLWSNVSKRNAQKFQILYTFFEWKRFVFSISSNIYSQYNIWCCD